MPMKPTQAGKLDSTSRSKFLDKNFGVGDEKIDFQTDFPQENFLVNGNIPWQFWAANPQLHFLYGRGYEPLLGPAGEVFFPEQNLLGFLARRNTPAQASTIMDIGAERLAKFQDFGLKEKAPKVVPKNTVVGESKTVYPPGPAAVPASATGAVDPQGRPAALQPQSASPHGRGGYGLAGRLGGGKGSAGLPPSNGNDEHGPPGRGSPIYE